MTFLAARGVGSAAIDLRGHGGLPQDAAFIAQGMQAMMDDVGDAVAALKAPLILAGHSLGALIVAAAAERLSPRGVILLAPAAPIGVAFSRALPKFPPAQAVQPPGAERARKWFLAGSRAGDISTYLAHLCPESPALLNECFHTGVAVRPDAIPCPVLCLSGAKDDSPLHPAGQDQAVAAYLGAELQIIPSSGHCLMLDDGWEETARAMRAWGF